MMISEIEAEEAKKAAAIRTLKERIPLMIMDCERSINKLESVPNPDGMLTPNRVVREIYKHLGSALQHAEAGTVNDIEKMAAEIGKAKTYAGDIDLNMSENIRAISGLGYRNGVEDALAQARIFGDKFMHFLIKAIDYARKVEIVDPDARKHDYAKGIAIEAGRIKKQGYTKKIEAALNKAIALSESGNQRRLESCLDLVAHYANAIGVDVKAKIEEMKSVARGGRYEN